MLISDTQQNDSVIYIYAFLFVFFYFMVYPRILNIVSFHHGSDSRESAHNIGDMGLIPGSGRSPGEENG